MLLRDTHVVRKSHNSSNGTIFVEVAARGVISSANGAYALISSISITVQDRPSRSWGQVRDRVGGAVLKDMLFRENKNQDVDNMNLQ